MRYNDRLQTIGKLHQSVVPNTYHYFRPQLQAPFLVWAETGPEKFYVNNKTGEFTITGTTDYFTALEFDPAVDKLIDLYEAFGFEWSLETVFEPETSLIHHSFTWGACHGDLSI